MGMAKRWWRMAAPCLIVGMFVTSGMLPPLAFPCTATELLVISQAGGAGQALVAHGGAVPADGPLCDAGDAAAAGVPLHAHAVLHRAGPDAARLPAWHLAQRAVRPRGRCTPCRVSLYPALMHQCFRCIST